MLPASFQSKMGKYEVEIQGVKIKVNVVGHSSLVDTYISELKSLAQKCIVGLDVKISASYPSLLLLCVGTRCLIIDLNMICSVPESLKLFLADETICFVGIGMSNKANMVTNFGRPYGKVIEYKTWVELGYLGASVLKKPSLEKCGQFSELTREVGMNVGTTAGASGNARVFSNEQIMYAINDVYSSFVIGNKLLSML